MTVHNEAADQVVAKIHESVRYGEGPAGTVSLELQGKLVEMLTDALAVERGIGASGAIRLGLTDDHQVCDEQLREVVKRIRKRIASFLLDDENLEHALYIIDTEAAR